MWNFDEHVQKLFSQNEKLLQRLTYAVYRDTGKPDTVVQPGPTAPADMDET